MTTDVVLRGADCAGALGLEKNQQKALSAHLGNALATAQNDACRYPQFPCCHPFKSLSEKPATTVFTRFGVARLSTPTVRVTSAET